MLTVYSISDRFDVCMNMSDLAYGYTAHVMRTNILAELSTPCPRRIFRQVIGKKTTNAQYIEYISRHEM